MTQVDFYNKVKTLAQQNGYIFLLGGGQWTNIAHKDVDESKKYVILEVMDVSWGVDDTTSAINNYTIKANIFIAKHDTIASLYIDKYENIIAPLINELEVFYSDLFSVCETDVSVSNVDYFELLNYLDINLTGPGISVTLKWMKY